jgi:hypothetical protein
MATRTTKTSTVKAKRETRAPKIGRARASTDTSAATDASPAHEVIALRAYERFCARGYAHGFDVEDWLAAERELQSPA